MLLTRRRRSDLYLGGASVILDLDLAPPLVDTIISSGQSRTNEWSSTTARYPGANGSMTFLFHDQS